MSTPTVTLGSTSKVRRAQVSLVGAGPGDPELLTLKAHRLLQEADVVLHDRLVGEGVLALIPAHVERFYVGKRRAQHSVPQEEINAALVGWAHQGKRVVRLKGGDPFLFGRGGEEMESLLTAGVSVDVVPGVTAASGCAAYAGIPLTHRDYADGVTLLTGHLPASEYDWPALIRARHTLVFYMGATNLAALTAALLEHGMRADMPLAIIKHGTLPTQRTQVATLSSWRAVIDSDAIGSPALVIIGEVAARDRVVRFP